MSTITATLVVAVPEDRRRRGVLTVVASLGRELRVVYSAPCSTEADQARANRAGNPERDPLLPYGHFPTGTYSVNVVDAGDDQRSFGPHPRLLLSPIAGDALTAAHNGRTGLMVHGGTLTTGGGLRPTYGCTRLGNIDMGAVVFFVHEFGIDRLVAHPVFGSA